MKQLDGIKLDKVPLSVDAFEERRRATDKVTVVAHVGLIAKYAIEH